MPHPLQLHELDDAFHGLAVGDLLALHGGREQHALQRVCGKARMAAGHDVVKHAHVPEQLDMLEGARDAEPRHGAPDQA